MFDWHLFNYTDFNKINLDWVTDCLKALLGGSTNQILSKKSDNDFDFEWVNNSGGGGGTSDYTDLTNKPKINNVELVGNKTLSALGITAAALGAYVKPSGGIPKSDLAGAVQTSLGKADTALQTVPSTYRTAAAQDVIDSGKADKIVEVDIVTNGAVTQAIEPNKIYHFTGLLTALTISFVAANNGIAQYHFDFNSGSTAPTLTLPNTVTMPDSFTVETNKHYEVDFLYNYGVVMEW